MARSKPLNGAPRYFAPSRPQAPSPAARPTPPRRLPADLPAAAGIGMASERARLRMVAALAQSGVRDSAVLDAMASIPRHVFVEQAFASRAYEDCSLPIGHGQTISRPTTVARMLEHALAPIAPPARASAVVLEVGTGCGYQAAVLARLVGQVVSIERLRALHEQARGNLRSARIGNLRLVFGDGRDGVGSMAPYDAIVAAAAGDRIPDAWLMQLKVGARLLAPVSEDGRQTLQMIERTSPSDWQMTRLDTVRFVPLRVGTN
ncbi:MAG: protein-L-isoaspartate(D-aspartate) O-methyltransferase [Burkholderiaceae bacterium]|nr:protein-L-isoaspartate(D-aspartate) O-methyltransferase [Burkholderiaceae bacterium]